MDRSENSLEFAVISEEDIHSLTPVMTRAFDDDAQRHLGQERGGPDGYDNGDFFRKWLFGYQETDGYKVMINDEIVGGAIVWILPDGHNIVGNIFVDPSLQDQGIGTEIWEFIEARYPQTKSWRLGTPKWAKKNHHFYESKCGFERVESDPIMGSPNDEFVYRKNRSVL
jgi:GNAT superfamily N-acetyltransferase